MKRLLPLIVFLSFILFSSPLSAGGFYLKSIGELNVEGASYDHLWYTGSNVTFTGVAPASSTVTIAIDGTSATATATSSGAWSYSTTLSQGDHSIILSTPSAESYNFTLTIGEVPEGVGAIQAPDTPVAGSVTPTVLALVLGTSLLLSPLLVNKAFRK